MRVLVAVMLIAACGGAKTPAVSNGGGAALALPGQCRTPAPPASDLPADQVAPKALDGIDVDGDGVADAVLALDVKPEPDEESPAPPCNQHCTFAIYVRRGACGYLVGNVDAQTIELGELRHGLHDLQTATKGPDGQAQFHHYEFDGTAYHEVEYKECATVDEDGVKPDDKRCGAWHPEGTD
jgi:hypothetical protein